MTPTKESLVRIPLEPPLPAGGLRAFGVGFERLFASFYAGPENLAIADHFQPEILLKLAELSPILIYGPHGAGKTSLSYTLQCRWEQSQSVRKAVQFSASDFARHLVGAIAADDMTHFRERVRKASSLMIDSLEGIASKSAAQDELIHVIDELTERGCPVFVTAVELPQAIRGIKKPLASRISAGSMISVRLPSKPTIQLTSTELLMSRGSFNLEPSALRQFIDRLPENLSMPTIRGMLFDYANAAAKSPVSPLKHGLFAEVSSSPSSTNEEAKLIDSIIRGRNPQLTIKAPQITKVVAKHAGCSPSDIRGSSRKSQLVLARSMTMYLCRKLALMSLEKIGEYFGGRDHTTVMHAVRKIEAKLTSDVALIRLKNDVLRDLNQSVE